MKAVKIDDELARSQKEEMKKKESNQDVCVKFPRSTPNEVVELYRKLDLQRRELERQRTYVKVNLLKKQEKRVFMNDSHEAEDGKKERLANSLMVNANQHIDVMIEKSEKNSEHQTEVLSEKVEEKASEDFLSPKKDLELQRENLVTESTSETSESCDFNADNLVVFTSDIEDNPSLGIVSREEELLRVEDETVMSHKQRLVTICDKRELACLNNQEKTAVQNFEAATGVQDEAIVVEEQDKGYNLQHVDELLKKKWPKYDEQKNVAEGQEVWEVATSMKAAEATCEVTLMMADDATLTAATFMKATITTSMVEATAAEIIEFEDSSSKKGNSHTEERLDIEIEEIW